MDENKINPIPEDSADNAEDIEEQSAAAVEEAVEDAAEESVEEAVIEEAAESVAEEESEASEEVVEAQEVAEPAKKKKMGKGAKVAIGFLVAILIISVLGMVLVFIASRPAKIDLEEVAVSVDGVDSNAAEFYQTYLYYYSYNSYYGYSDDQLRELAIDQLVFTNALYAEAKANNFTLSAEAQSQIDEQLASVRETAEAESMSADEYLDTAFCPGFTMEMFEVIAEKSVVAQEYYSSKIADIENGYKGDDGLKKIETAYNEEKSEYDLTDASYWYFDATAEDSEKNANAIVAAVKGGTSFDEAVKSIADAEVKELTGLSKSELESGSFPEDAIEWIYETDAQGNYVNGTGAVEVVSDDSLIYVLYVNNAPARNEVYPVSAYYIQVDISTDTSVKSEDMLKIEAKNAADKILKEFEATDKTAESFAELLKEHDEGDNALVSGDIFESLQGDGSEDEAVEAWLFGADRKDGDYALVEADGCYYILFYIEKAENPVWYDTICNALINEEATALQEALLSDSNESKVVYDEVVDEVIAYVADVVSSQYSY